MAEPGASFQKSKKDQYSSFLAVTKWAIIGAALVLVGMAVFLL